MSSEFSLVKIARILVIYWIASWVIAPLYCYLTTGALFGLSVTQSLALAGIDLIALGLLFYPLAQRRLGRWFYPTIVLLCSLPFFLERLWLLLISVAPTGNEIDAWRASSVRDDFVLLVVLIAWQYPFSRVVSYIGAISLVDWLLNFTVTHQLEAPGGSMLPMLAGRAVILLLAGYAVSWLRQRQQQQQAALIEAHRQQVAANTTLARYAASVEQLSISRERNRLARELHDTLAHSLSAISVQLEAVSSLWDVDATAARKMLGRADETTRNGLTEARRSLQSLRATPLEQFGLALALRDMAEAAARRADLVLDLDVPDLAVNLPSPMEQDIYRIAQEALENVVRHARARHVSVRLCYAPNELQLLIADDGVGFPVEQSTRESNHWGIRGMYERALSLGSSLRIVSQQEQGTQLALVLTLEA